MRMARPLPYPKKIDIKEKLYYHYKVDASRYALFDSDLDTPIAYGSWNFVGATINKLPPSSTIFYYEVDKQIGWKMKRSYSPDKQTQDTEERTKSVEKAEEKKKDLT
jgi:hypothetical protein